MSRHTVQRGLISILLILASSIASAQDRGRSATASRPAMRSSVALDLVEQTILALDAVELKRGGALTELIQAGC
jgi:hypothetical protein